MQAVTPLNSVVVAFGDNLKRVLSARHLGWLRVEAEKEWTAKAELLSTLSPNAEKVAEGIYHRFGGNGANVSIQGLTKLLAEAKESTFVELIGREIALAETAMRVAEDAKAVNDYEMAIDAASRAFSELKVAVKFAPNRALHESVQAIRTEKKRKADEKSARHVQNKERKRWENRQRAGKKSSSQVIA